MARGQSDSTAQPMVASRHRAQAEDLAQSMIADNRPTMSAAADQAGMRLKTNREQCVYSSLDQMPAEGLKLIGTEPWSGERSLRPISWISVDIQPDRSLRVMKHTRRGEEEQSSATYVGTDTAQAMAAAQSLEKHLSRDPRTKLQANTVPFNRLKNTVDFKRELALHLSQYDPDLADKLDAYEEDPEIKAIGAESLQATSAGDEERRQQLFSRSKQMRDQVIVDHLYSLGIS